MSTQTAGSDFSFGMGVNLSQEGVSEMGDAHTYNEEVDRQSPVISSWGQQAGSSSGPGFQSRRDYEIKEIPTSVVRDVKTSSKPEKKVGLLGCLFSGCTLASGRDSPENRGTSGPVSKHAQQQQHHQDNPKPIIQTAAGASRHPHLEVVVSDAQVQIDAALLLRPVSDPVGSSPLIRVGYISP